MSQTGNDNWFEATWAYREESLYPSILRRRTTGEIYTLNEEVFSQRFGYTADPRWLHCGVLLFPANERQGTCALVTSGLSNDWNAEQPNPDGVSGLGFELRLELKECARWGIVILLRLMALQLLTAAGVMPGPILHDRMILPLDGPIVPGSQLTHLLALASPESDSPLQLTSGRFDLLLLTGISQREAELAASSGANRLAALLPREGGCPITDPLRLLVV